MAERLSRLRRVTVVFPERSRWDRRLELRLQLGQYEINLIMVRNIPRRTFGDAHAVILTRPAWHDSVRMGSGTGRQFA